jgi:hypothetical protein
MKDCTDIGLILLMGIINEFVYYTNVFLCLVPVEVEEVVTGRVVG